MTSSSRGLTSSSFEPVLVVHRGIVYQVQVWSEREWVDVSPDRRPRIAEHSPRYGWVVAVPVEFLN